MCQKRTHAVQQQYASPTEGEHDLPLTEERLVMITRRKLLMGVCICIPFAAVRARAGEPSAKSFVEAIYANYIGKDSKGFFLESDAAMRRNFDPKLAALILKDRKEARGEVGKLDFDPFIDAQDWGIDRVDVEIREVGPDKTRATVSFKNLGDPKSVILDLVRLRMGWRIANITWDRKHRLGEDTLRGILTKE